MITERQTSFRLLNYKPDTKLVYVNIYYQIFWGFSLWAHIYIWAIFNFKPKTRKSNYLET